MVSQASCSSASRSERSVATQVIQDKPPIGAHLLAGLPASELSDALKQIRELQRLLGKKATENEILREAVEVSSVVSEFRSPAHGRRLASRRRNPDHAKL
jgi:hypothetical protein